MPSELLDIYHGDRELEVVVCEHCNNVPTQPIFIHAPIRAIVCSEVCMGRLIQDYTGEDGYASSL